jgi:competence protein ComEA
MDEERISAFVRNHLLIIILLVSGVTLLLFGIFQQTPTASKPQVLSTQDESMTDSQADEERIMVDVAGAVVQPGVYNLPFDARLKDALSAAKGLTQQADLEYVSRTFNQAKKLADGEKIYIPAVGEASTESSASTININSASLDALDALPGIGQVTAQKIIDSRPYSTVDELVDRKIISQSTFTKIKEAVSVY